MHRLLSLLAELLWMMIVVERLSVIAAFLQVTALFLKAMDQVVDILARQRSSMSLKEIDPAVSRSDLQNAVKLSILRWNILRRPFFMAAFLAFISLVAAIAISIYLLAGGKTIFTDMFLISVIILSMAICY